VSVSKQEAQKIPSPTIDSTVEGKISYIGFGFRWDGLLCFRRAFSGAGCANPRSGR
jgi:hypothetical protein